MVAQPQVDAFLVEHVQARRQPLHHLPLVHFAEANRAVRRAVGPRGGGDPPGQRRAARRMPDDRRKIAYALTEKGFALLPTMVALRQWGERWETRVPAFPILVDTRDRRPIAAVAVLAHDGRVLGRGDLIWALPGDVADDPGA